MREIDRAAPVVVEAYFLIFGDGFGGGVIAIRSVLASGSTGF